MRPPLNRWSLCRLLFVLSLMAMASLPFGALAAQDAAPVSDAPGSVAAAPRIGVVTMQPGEIFFERFGHDAIVVIDPAVFWGGDGYLKLAQTMIDEIHRIPPAPGFERVLVPGEIERNCMARYSRDGIPVPKSIYEFLAA